MYSIKNIDGKESNTAKGVNIATEFNEFKDTLFNKKIIRHKVKRIQNKKHKIRTYKMESTKYDLQILMIKICFRWWCSYTSLFLQGPKKIDSQRWP